MATVTISDDQNILTVNSQQFKFNAIDNAIEDEFYSCSKCNAFNLCCELQNTVESGIPFHASTDRMEKTDNF